MELKDKVVLITGGGTGLGKVTALALAREGAHLAIGYSRSESDALATVQEARALGVRAMAVQAEVADAKQVNAMAAKVLAENGRIDVLINNAGMTVFVPFDDLEGMKEEDWDRLMDVNVKGPFLCCKVVAPIMKRQGDGRIVNIGTISGLRPVGSSIGYATSKAALTHFSKCLAKGLAPTITVNVVAPGAMLTRWYPNITGEQIQKTIDGNPLKRYAALEDVAAAILMVAKNDSMTGQVVVVDAGATLVR
jgi:3-oxoacyl-[acyl-carrier protein] reductase